MVWTWPRMAVTHALALEIHVVIQVVSCRGLRLGMMIMIYKITFKYDKKLPIITW